MVQRAVRGRVGGWWYSSAGLDAAIGVLLVVERIDRVRTL